MIFALEDLCHYFDKCVHYYFNFTNFTLMNLFNISCFTSHLIYFFHYEGVQVTDVTAYVDTPTNLTCTITGSTTKATVTWRNSLNEQLQFQEGELGADGVQISTLTVPSPRKGGEVFTCVVTSGEYPTSPSFETVAEINTFCKFMFR